MARHKEYYKEEGGGFPQVRAMVSLCLLVVRSCTKNNYVLINLLFGLCRSVWVIDLLVTLPSPHPRAPACPFTPKVLWTKQCAPILYPFIVFTFKLTIAFIKEFDNDVYEEVSETSFGEV
jgi:hypothetical protein